MSQCLLRVRRSTWKRHRCQRQLGLGLLESLVVVVLEHQLAQLLVLLLRPRACIIIAIIAIVIVIIVIIITTIIRHSCDTDTAHNVRTETSTTTLPSSLLLSCFARYNDMATTAAATTTITSAAECLKPFVFALRKFVAPVGIFARHRVPTKEVGNHSPLLP